MPFHPYIFFCAVALILALLNRPARALALLVSSWLGVRFYLGKGSPPWAELQGDVLATLLITWAERTSKKEPNGVFRNLRSTYRLFIRVLLGPILIGGLFSELLSAAPPHLEPFLAYIIPRGALIMVLAPLVSQISSCDRHHFFAQFTRYFGGARGRTELLLWIGLNALILQLYHKIQSRSHLNDGLSHAEYFAVDFLIAIPIFFSALRFPPLLNAGCMMLLALRAILTAQTGLGPFWDLPLPDRPIAVGLYILIFGTIGSLLNTQQEESRTVREELAIRAENRARELETERIRASTEREARESAERAVETRNRFLGMASHELKNPLSALMLTLEMMERQIPSSSATDHPSPLHTTARNAVSETRRMARLIDNLLDVARLEIGKLDHHPVDNAPISDMLKCTIAGFQGLLESAGCAARVRIQDGIHATADPDQIQQVFQNLISNAIKFGRKNPIDITLEQAGTHWKFSVHDRGEGIRPELKDRIFEPYNRTTDRSRYPGMGIGLHLSREIARAHGGDIAFESTPGAGTTFTATLPKSPSTVLPIHERKAA